MPRTLLLADDSLTIQRVIALTFADEDVQVVTADDGDKALAALNESPPDVVLADVDMPGMSGLELARHIKATPTLAHIPVLLLTGAFDRIASDEAHAAGCAGVLEKPFDPQVLVARVRELLSGSALADVPAAVPPSAPDRVDEYLEELDAALNAAVRTDRTPPPEFEPEPEPERMEDLPPPSDWLRTPAKPVVQTSSPAAALSTGPSLAEAFAALLDAERASARTAPSSVPPGLDAAVEVAVRRALERLSERMVREMASDILTRVAERIVREEIARIRDETR